MVAVVMMGIVFITGFLLGAIFMAAIGVLSAGGYEAGQHRKRFLEILIEQFEIEPMLAANIAREALDEWTLWREKSRPLLWRLGLEWSEYIQTTKAEFSAYYERNLPEAEDGSEMLDVQSRADYLDNYTNLSSPKEIQHESTPDSDGTI